MIKYCFKISRGQLIFRTESLFSSSQLNARTEALIKVFPLTKYYSINFSKIFKVFRFAEHVTHQNIRIPLMNHEKLYRKSQNRSKPVVV